MSIRYWQTLQVTLGVPLLPFIGVAPVVHELVSPIDPYGGVASSTSTENGNTKQQQKLIFFK